MRMSLMVFELYADGARRVTRQNASGFSVGGTSGAVEVPGFRSSN